MKKCFKCGNNVLPGTSTCPGCGSSIRNNTNSKQSFTPNVKRTVDYTPRRVHDSVSPNTAGYSSGGKGGGIVVIIIFMFFLLPIVIAFNFMNKELSEFKKDSEEFFENVPNNDTEYIDPSDYVLLDRVEKTEFGEIVMFFENTYIEPLSVDVDLKYLNEYGSELTDYQRFGSMSIAPNSEQVMVFTSFNIDYRSYKYSFDASDLASFGTSTIDLEKIKTNDTGEKLIVSYLNDGDNDIEMVELCVLFYNDDKLMHANCGRDYDIARNEELLIEFDYLYESKYKGLVFNKYEYYLHEVLSD